jgi:hypothetical protein
MTTFALYSWQSANGQAGAAQGAPSHRHTLSIARAVGFVILRGVLVVKGQYDKAASTIGRPRLVAASPRWTPRYPDGQT